MKYCDRAEILLSGYDCEHDLMKRQNVAVGLAGIGHQHTLYRKETRLRAVRALCEALEHDTWKSVRAHAAMALERAAQVELDDGVQWRMRSAASTLRMADKGEEQVRQLRKDLDQIQKENRKLRVRLSVLEARDRDGSGA